MKLNLLPLFGNLSPVFQSLYCCLNLLRTHARCNMNVEDFLHSYHLYHRMVDLTSDQLTIPCFALVTNPSLLPCLSPTGTRLRQSWAGALLARTLLALISNPSLLPAMAFLLLAESELNTGACTGFPPPRTVILLVAALIIQSIAI